MEARGTAYRAALRYLASGSSVIEVRIEGIPEYADHLHDSTPTLLVAHFSHTHIEAHRGCNLQRTAWYALSMKAKKSSTKKKAVVKKQDTAKKKGRTPSARKKKALKLLAENGGNVSKAMRDAGYSPSYVANPQKFSRSASTQEILDELIPRAMVIEAHVNLLRASKIEYMMFPAGTEEEDIEELLAAANCTVKKIRSTKVMVHVWFFAADNKARKDAIDMAYKLRGEFAPEKYEVTDPLRNLSDAELADEIRSAKAFFAKK